MQFIVYKTGYYQGDHLFFCDMSVGYFKARDNFWMVGPLNLVSFRSAIYFIVASTVP